MDEDSTDERESSDNESAGLTEEWNDLEEEREKREKFVLGDLPLIDWNSLKSKLEQTPPVPKLSSVPQGLRLIDVERRRVVKAPLEPFDYVCLSYTWGDAPEFQARTDNIVNFQQEGALHRAEKPQHPEGPDNLKLPATIQDALTVCQHLGKDYLWVDRLCIIQDGPEKEMQIHFDEMGRIYNHACVTIVAYEGADARYGLHGISRRIKFGISDKDFWTRSEWYKRAWTYQEAILSRNMIVFTMGGVIFEHEGEATLTRKFSGLSFQPYLPLFHGAVDYSSAVENYTERELRHQDDVVNAFSGICCYLFDQDHQFGMPLNDFDNAMQWLVKSDGHERTSNGGHTFPTWSWASIKGRAFFPRSLAALPLASWAFGNCGGSKAKLSLRFPNTRDFAFALPSSGVSTNHHGLALTRLAFHIYKADPSLVKPGDTTSRNHETLRESAVQSSSHATENAKRATLGPESSRPPGGEDPYSGQHPGSSPSPSIEQNSEPNLDPEVDPEVLVKPIATDIGPFNTTLNEFVARYPSFSRFVRFCRQTTPKSSERPFEIQEFTIDQAKIALKPGRIMANAWISTLEVTSAEIDFPTFGIQIEEGNAVGAGYLDDPTFGKRSRYAFKGPPIWSREREVQELEEQELEARNLEDQELEARRLQLRILGVQKPEAQRLRARDIDVQEFEAQEHEIWKSMVLQKLKVPGSKKQDLEVKLLRTQKLLKARELEVRTLERRNLRAQELAVQGLEALVFREQELNVQELEVRVLEALVFKELELKVQELKAQELKAWKSRLLQQLKKPGSKEQDVRAKILETQKLLRAREAEAWTLKRRKTRAQRRKAQELGAEELEAQGLKAQELEAQELEEARALEALALEELEFKEHELEAQELKEWKPRLSRRFKTLGPGRRALEARIVETQKLLRARELQIEVQKLRIRRHEAWKLAEHKRSELLNSEGLGSRKLAFVALSVSMASGWEIRRIASSEATTSRNYFELFENIPSGSEAPLVSVMAIEESNNAKGVFKRIGFGFIDFQKWCDEVHRERRSIVLE